MDGQQWVKTYDVILSNMEGSPSYPLSHQLTIGSEIGNIIINDPSVSPRHATVLLQEEVISIMDHGSVSGTFVNGTKIPAGKFIILEDTDSVSVGDLEVKIGVKTKAVEDTGRTPPKHDQLDDEEAKEFDEEDDESEDEVEEETEEEEDEEELEAEPEKELTVTKTRGYMQGPAQGKSLAATAAAAKSKKKWKVKFSLPSYDAANGLIRVMALSADLLLSYIILVIFIPFDDFRNFLNFIPEAISELIDFKWENIWLIATEEAGQVTDVLKEIYTIANEMVPVLHLVLVFFLLRLITTLLFGVSISEFMFGIRANFNRIWARIGGMLRVILGMFTWPFLIFDLPSLASKRTFKEFITFTNTYVGSRVTLFFGIVFYMPMLIVLLLVSPMILGLELVEPIPFTATVSQRVKPKAPVEEGAVVVEKSKVGGKYMGMTLSFDPAKISLIPTFKFKGDKSKLNMNAGLSVVNRETDREVLMELYKTFDFKQLLKLGMSGNYFLHEKYQKVYNYAYSAENTDRFFKAAENVKAEEAFGSEVVQFTEMSFGLGIETLPDFIMAQTPLIKSVVDYRTSLMSLFEYKDFTDISVIKLGKILCLRVTYDKQKPFDLVMPLMRGEGRIYKISYDKKEALQQVRNDFYKFSLDDLVWGVPEQAEKVEAFNALQVIDLFTTDIQKGTISTEKGQSLYGFFYEKSADVLKNGKPLEYDHWKAAVQNVINVIPHLKTETPVDGTAPAEDVKAKLKSNFSDLFNALENKNKPFFGIEESPTV